MASSLNHRFRPPSVRQARIVALLVGLAVCSALSCERKRDVCGDGVATGSEECDWPDVRGKSCADVFSHTVGSIGCSIDCTFNINACSPDDGGCGNGIQEFGEMCDCGHDPGILPATCSDVNGGPDANCTDSCGRIDRCGDGIRSGDEECDCGTDAAQLPLGCLANNGDPASTCDASCLERPCEATLLQPCDPINPVACCPDANDRPTRCAPPGVGDPLCLYGCNATSDCCWSNACLAQPGGSVCYPAVCGVGGPADALNDFCEVPGGGLGWCAPLFERATPDTPQRGVCVESGVAAHGEACPALPALQFPERTTPACELGLCVATQDPSVGLCRGLCDWAAAYQANVYGVANESLPCPAGSSCVGLAHLDVATGARTGDLSFCVEAGPLDLPHTATPCSLVTGQLLANPAASCGDFQPGDRCELLPVDNGGVADGTLVGACVAAAPATRAVWETCDASGDVCPDSTLCRDEDFFAAAPAGPMRCLPLCDAGHHTSPGDCATLGATDPTALCRSLSERSAPTDVSPTRLGLCALP